MTHVSIILFLFIFQCFISMSAYLARLVLFVGCTGDKGLRGIRGSGESSGQVFWPPKQNRWSASVLRASSL